jgi:hypothetical protein
LKEAIFYLTTLLDRRYINCIQKIEAKKELISFLSELDIVESCMLALPYEIVKVLLEEKFKAYNDLFKESILPFLHLMDIDINALEELFSE